MVSENADRSLNFKIISPSGIIKEISCDSVILSMADGDEVKDGFIGIRYGHENSVIALKPGNCICRQNGSDVYSVFLGEGFATVNGSDVTVIIDSKI